MKEILHGIVRALRDVNERVIRLESEGRTPNLAAREHLDAIEITLAGLEIQA